MEEHLGTKPVSETEWLLGEFLESDEIAKAALLFIARVQGPIKEGDLMKVSKDLLADIVLKTTMLRLVEEEQLVYLGDHYWASDQEHLDAVLPMIKAYRQEKGQNK